MHLLRSRSAVISVLTPALAGAYAAVLALRPLRDPDLFWHLAVGRYVAEHHALPTRNLWSYTAPDHPFLASSWLFDLGLHGLERAGGFVLVQVFIALVLAVAFVCVFLAARARGASPELSLAVSLALATASEARFTPRPQALTYLFLAASGLLLSGPGDDLPPRRVACLAFVIALWANVHAGVVFGLGLVACRIAGVVLDTVRAEGWHGLRRQRPRRWLVAGAVCVAAAAVTPHTLGLFRYAIFHLGEVNAVVELGEFAAPTLRAAPVFWAVLVTAPLVFLVARRRLGLGDWLVLLAFGLLAVRAVRVVVEFFIVIGPPLALAVGEVLRPLRESRRLRRLAWALPPAALAGSLAVAPFPWTHPFLRPRAGLDVWHVPVAALARTRDRGIAGRCFAGWDVSGLIEWGAPESSVQIDPRLLAYPPDVFRMLADAERSPAEFDRLVSRYDIEWAFRSQRFLHYVGAGMFGPDRWAVIDWDESGLVLLRRDIPRFQSLIAQQEYRELLPSSAVLEQWATLKGPARERWVAEARRLVDGSARVINPRVVLAMEALRSDQLDDAWSGLEGAADRARELFRIHPQVDGTKSQLISTAFTLVARRMIAAGRRGDAERVSREALELAPRSAETWTGVGYAWLSVDPSRAADAFRRALAIRADAPAARAGLDRARAGTGP